MATKIRLARHGHKDYAYYHIVVADSRAPRDGKFIERIGSYNPNTNPATVDLNFERALYWVNVGAQPTDTVRNILSGEGVMLMKHLQGGVRKGAFDEAAAQRKFEAWKAEKDAKNGKISAEEVQKAAKIAKDRMAQEIEANKQKAAEVAKKRQEALEAEAAKAAEEAAEAAPAEEAPAAE
ncbi:MAG: 30S ribosomal protein S16 [Paludibacteraceae bacterium]|nr:30S ribosomal protein S16 [Paludibacteraceae bacterium]MBQ9705539.1 30S ribosomal protein S16 [Paludibacteraceae bacterium]